MDRLCDDMVTMGVQRTGGFFGTAMKQPAGQRHHYLAMGVYDRLRAYGLEPSVVATVASCTSLLMSESPDAPSSSSESYSFRACNLACTCFIIARATPSFRAYMTVRSLFAQQSDWSIPATS